MAVLRLFAAAREAAGTATADVPGTTVDDVLDSARSRFGPELARVIEASRVWRNGEPADGDDRVGPDDEVAVLPPVSGGADPGGRPPSSSGRRRPTFAPTELPPTPARRTNRSPGAEAAGVTGASRRPVATPDGSMRRPGPPGPPRRRDRSGRAPGTGPAAGGGGARPGRGDRPAEDDRRRPGTGDRGRRAGGRAHPGAGPPVATEQGAPPVSAGREGPAPRRMRTVQVPATGHVTIRGRARRVAVPRARRTAFARRYAVVYDTDGPKVTLGVVWFVAAIASMVLGWWAVTLLFAVVAGWAASECAERWDEVGVAVEPWVAGLGAAVVAASASMGTAYLGGGILCLVLAAVTRTAFAPLAREETLAAAGRTVLCALPFALAGGSVILTYDLEIGAAVVLVVSAAAYEAGDFLIGSGSSNSIEGPVTGMVTIGVVSMGVAVLAVPPFAGPATYTFAALAAVACPLGQLGASALLPAADARAPAVRRFDSYLLLAPMWVWTVGLFMAGRGL